MTNIQTHTLASRPFGFGALRTPTRALSVIRRPGWAWLTLGFGVVLCVAYLLLVNSTATIGLSTKAIDREIASLHEETRQLEIELANLQSFATIERTGKALELTQQITPEFVTSPDDNVALR